jgi:ribosomal-protein-serine acetyltransferase
MAWIRFEPQPIEDRRRMLERWERNWLAGGDVHFAICRGEVVLGAAGLHRREADGLAIGYWVDRDHLHQGVATTAARALTDLGFTIPGIAWVDIHHDLSNVASRRVPEKLGYTRLADEQRTGDLPPADTGVGAVWRMARDCWATFAEG